MVDNWSQNKLVHKTNIKYYYKDKIIRLNKVNGLMIIVKPSEVHNFQYIHLTVSVYYIDVSH